MSLEEEIQRESERFHNLFDRLSDTQWSEGALGEAQSHLMDYQNQVKIIQDRINLFNAEADKEQKRLLEIKGHGVKHIWYKIRGKLEQRLDQQEKVWLKQFEKSKEEEQHLIVLNQQINSAENFLYQCQQTHQEYLKTKQTLDKLLDHFFSGITPSYPHEDFIEQNLKKNQEQLIILQNQYRILTHVFYLLEKAHQALTFSRQSLDQAFNMNTFDLLSKSSFADVAVSSYLAKARNASIQAQQFINETRRIYPNIPHIGDLHIQQDNLVFNIMFDNIWTDMNMRQMIRQTSQRIYHADMILTNLLFDIKTKLDKCHIDKDNISKHVKQLANEHFIERINIVRKIIQPPPPYASK